MNKENELQNYLSISPNKFGIYLFDTKNLTNLYKEEIILNNDSNYQNHDELKKFLDDNIFKIEKLSGKFIESIHLVLEDKKIFNLEIGIKKKNYEKNIYKKNLEPTLTDARDLFKENYKDYKIMHMIITNYIVEGKHYEKFIDNLYSDNICLEIKFISISNKIIYEIDKVLDTYQIKIINYLDQNYINKVVEEKNFQLPKKAHFILNGFNENEVQVIPKKIGKMGFFEKFFQLFS